MKKKSRILEEVHETARGLYRSGMIDKREMKKFDALCLSPVEPFSPTRIKRLRRELNVSQSVFATILNTSVSTVQKWEIGDKKPGGPSLKLLNLLEQKGLDAVA